MLKKQILLFILLGCSALLVFSCKSEPESVTEEPVGPDVSVTEIAEPSVVDEALTALRNEVTQLRDSLLAFGFNETEPDLWIEADTSFQSAESSFGKNNEAAQSGYLAAKELYTKLMEQGFSGLSDKIAAARKDAADSGAASRFPDEFAALENSGAALSADNPEQAFKEASAILNSYNAMSAYMLADSLKKRITDMNLVAEDGETVSPYAEDYTAGCEAMTAVEDSLAHDAAAAFASARTAVEKFNAVLDSWFKKCADEKSVEINQLVARCDEIKAATAVKEPYAAAVAARGKAVQLYNGKSYEAAFNALNEAAGLFEMVYGQAVIKRDAAIRAMENAKKQQETASALAAVADEKAPLAGDDEPELPLPGEEPAAGTAPAAEEPVMAADEPVTAGDEPVMTAEPAGDNAAETDGKAPPAGDDEPELPLPGEEPAAGTAPAAEEPVMAADEPVTAGDEPVMTAEPAGDNAAETDGKVPPAGDDDVAGTESNFPDTSDNQGAAE